MTEEDLLANYKRAFGNRIGFGQQPALILIDFVQAYFDTGCDLYAGVERRSPRRSGSAKRRDAGRAGHLHECRLQPQALNGGRFYQKSLTLHNFIAGAPDGRLADRPGPVTTNWSSPSSIRAPFSEPRSPRL